MGSTKTWFCVAALVLLSLVGKAQADQGVFLRDAFGNPIGSTLSLGKYYLNVNASLNEVATSANGAAAPALGKMASGIDGGGLTRFLLTDTAGKLQTAAVASLADGADVTEGAKADAAATDSTSAWSVVSILKGLWAKLATINTTLGSPFQAGGSIGNTTFGATQSGSWTGVGVTGTFWQATQPISAAALPLPAGAATSALQTTINTTLGTPMQNSGGSVGISGTLPAFAAIPAVKIDQTTPGTTNGVQVNAALPAGTNLMGKVGIDQTTPGTTNGVQINAAVPAGTNVIGKVSIDQTTPGTTNLVNIGTNGTVQTKAPLNSTGSGSAAAATVSTVITLTAPANAVGFILQNDGTGTSTDAIRWAIGRTATTTLGQELQPGQDTGFVPCGHDVSLVAKSGTQTYDIQWVSQ